MTPDNLALLRKPFPAETIGKLPRVTCPACSKKNCSEHKKAKCQTCHAYVSTAHIHLDYVGHAAVTDRLLSVDPEWSWEPFGTATDGLPALATLGGETSLWIRLTVCGITRPAVGTAASGSFELPKQLISDAIRNGAMRFGVALDLWSKEDLAPAEAEDRADTAKLEEIVAALNALPDEDRAKTKRDFIERFGTPSSLNASRAEEAILWIKELPF